MTIDAPIVLPGDPALPQPLAEGLARHQANHLDDAERAYNDFLRRVPGHPQALAFLGALTAKKGDLATAVVLLRKAIHKNPRLADARYCLCNVLQAQGRPVEAITPCTYAKAFGHPNAGERLESILGKLGDAERARSAGILAGYYLSTNQLKAALAYSQDAVRLTKGDYSAWALFVRCVAPIRFTSTADEGLLASITRAFFVDNIDYRQLVGPALSALAHDRQIAPQLLDIEAASDPVALVRERLQGGSFEAWNRHKLLNRLMRVVVVSDIRFEKLLTSLREGILWALVEAADIEKVGDVYLPIVTSLAMQSFLNEYVWTTTAEEAAAVGNLAEVVSDKLARQQEVSPCLLAIIGAYSPLHRLPWARTLPASSWPEDLAEVIRTQVLERLEEEGLREEIPTLLPIRRSVARSVRAQYEENPFPRWTTLPVGGPQVSLEEYIGRSLPYLRKAIRKPPSHPRILVAGCGTGLIPNHLATSIENASITAVDLSLRSLGYARRKTKELEIKSIEYVHGDINDLGALQRQFDHVNCYGVLHHMEDISQGWRSLEGCLKPGGTMQIGLYSEIARQPVIRMRQHIEECGYQSTVEDMRRCRQDIMGRRAEPLFKAIVDSLAFFNMSEFRDLVFHAQEHLVTLPMLRDMIRDLGLRFLGFQHGDPSIATRYRSRFPQDPEMLSLNFWHEFEKDNPTTFGNCYNFWVCKEPDISSTSQTSLRCNECRAEAVATRTVFCS